MVEKKAGDIIARATAHFDAQERDFVEVDEWGDENGSLKIYWTPMTIGDRTKIAAKTKGRDGPESLVEVIILKAQDEEGNQMFTLNDKMALNHHTDSRVLVKIASAIMRDEIDGQTEGN